MKGCPSFANATFTVSPQVQEMMHKKGTSSTQTDKAPDFLVALRPHAAWEKTPVKLFCTVDGHPRPIVKWLGALASY
jgi:hypothetical protein